ncbi:macrolide export ATP-binding/permease protein MacB [Verrucomicrobiota bacterium]|nr:macrolide export ATP-binding/permease protein MacB [Verrucomicrobiota bacterium]
MPVSAIFVEGNERILYVKGEGDVWNRRVVKLAQRRWLDGGQVGRGGGRYRQPRAPLAAPLSMPSLIAIRGLRKTYQMGDESVHALAGVDLEFQRGEFVAILVPRARVSRP